MANVIITLKIMLKNPNINLGGIKKKVSDEIISFGGEVGKIEIEPIAFGLKALNFIFVLDEKKGGTDVLEEKLSKLKGISSVQVTDVRRQIG